MKSLSLLLLTLLALLLALPAASAADQEFTKPMNGKNRLDYCFAWQDGCGQKAADAFCEKMGFANASDFTIAQGIGANSPTRTIGDGSVCDNNGCDGFMSITCYKAPLVMKLFPTYPKPDVDGVRLDWCFSWQKSCGQRAADAFCKSKGWTRAESFQKAENVGPTRVWSTGQLCDGTDCDGFKTLTCE